MGDILKVLGISFLILVAIAAAGNYSYGAGGCMQVISVDEKDQNSDRFVADVNAYDDRLVFSYIPRTVDITGDYYVTYNITADGNILTVSDRESYENISVDEPVVVEITRESSSLYEIEMLIEDAQENIAHRSSIRVGPQGQ